MIYLRYLLLGWMTLLVFPVTAAGATEVHGERVVYVEQDPGNQPVTVTLFANRNYLLMRDDIHPADFILLDRAQQRIYNVNRSDQSILIIDSKPLASRSPIELEYAERRQLAENLPPIDGHALSHYRYLAGGEICYDVMVLPEDVLPMTLSAMREFRRVLAGEHATSLDSIPRDMLDACDLALNVFQPVRHLAHGLPVKEWGRDGYQRSLKSYQADASLPAAALQLPAGYQTFDIDELTGR